MIATIISYVYLKVNFVGKTNVCSWQLDSSSVNKKTAIKYDHKTYIPLIIILLLWTYLTTIFSLRVYRFKSTTIEYKLTIVFLFFTKEQFYI